jgi:hypothetical protein
LLANLGAAPGIGATIFTRTLVLACAFFCASACFFALLLDLLPLGRTSTIGVDAYTEAENTVPSPVGERCRSMFWFRELLNVPNDVNVELPLGSKTRRSRGDVGSAVVDFSESSEGGVHDEMEVFRESGL